MTGKAVLGEINVLCTDLERSLAFYRDALGLAETGREGGAVHLDAGPTSLLLLPFATVPRTAQEYGAEPTVSFDMLVEDADRTVDALVAAGGTRLDSLGGGRGWAVADPDGNVIEVLSRR